MNVTGYAVLACLLLYMRFVYMTRFNSKDTPTINTNYGCHIKALELV